MKKKIKISKVQEAFNKFIVRMDKRCMVRDDTPCSGSLQCSHYFPVGGNGGLRFYVFNAHTQCAGHHLAHHNRDPYFYTKYMLEYFPEELAWMESVKGKPVRYTQAVLHEIYDACNNDDFDKLKEIVEGLF